MLCPFCAADRSQSGNVRTGCIQGWKLGGCAKYGEDSTVFDRHIGLANQTLDSNSERGVRPEFITNKPYQVVFWFYTRSDAVE